MESAKPAPHPGKPFGTAKIPAAVFEIFGYLAAVAAGSLAFITGWLSVDGAVALTVLVLVSLIVLSWINLGKGRHPVFLFLCTLTFFQGGRLIAFCMGGEPDPMRVELMGLAFDATHETQAITLLCITLSAICIYLTCRLGFSYIPPSNLSRVRRYLPYLYFAFFATLPFLVFKNLRYFEYAQQHGGYSFIYVDRARLVTTVPTLVRLITQLTPPAFLAIFLFETRRRVLVLITTLYFASASIILFLGQRGTFFVTVLTLWFIARFKSQREPRLGLLVAAVAILVGIGVFIQSERQDEVVIETISDTTSLPIHFLDSQGASLGVTEIGVQYRDTFAPHSYSYLLNELRNAFVPSDASTYRHESMLANDISMFLSKSLFASGIGVGSSYLAEAYILGGLSAVVIISILLGVGLRLIYRSGRRTELLLLGSMILMDVLWMPRGDLITWVSALARNLGTLGALAAGWAFYRVLASIQKESLSPTPIAHP